MTDDIQRLLDESVGIVHRFNKGLPVQCVNCNVWFLNRDDFFRHVTRHRHPSGRRR